LTAKKQVGQSDKKRKPNQYIKGLRLGSKRRWGTKRGGAKKFPKRGKGQLGEKEKTWGEGKDGPFGSTTGGATTSTAEKKGKVREEEN